MTGAAARRGQPLAALAMVMGGWIAMRVMMWDAAAIEPPQTEKPAARLMFATIPAARSPAGGARPARVQSDGADVARPAAAFEPQRPIVPPGWAETRPIDPPLPALSPPDPPPLPASPQPARADGRVAMAAGHQLLWMAAVSQLPLPAGLLAAASSQPGSAASRPAPRNGTADLRRWSMDGWLMLRRDGKASLAAGGLPASYGASQAGAVLRYRLAPGSANRPTAYLRVTARAQRFARARGGGGALGAPAAPGSRCRGGRTAPCQPARRCPPAARCHGGERISPGALASGAARRGLCPGRLCRRQRCHRLRRWAAAHRPPDSARRIVRAARRRRCLGRRAARRSRVDVGPSVSLGRGAGRRSSAGRRRLALSRRRQCGAGIRACLDAVRRFLKPFLCCTHHLV